MPALIKITTLLVICLLIAAFAILYLGKNSGINLTSVRLTLKMKGELFQHPSKRYQLPYRLYTPVVKGSEETLLPLVITLQSAYGRGDNNIGQLDKLVKELVSTTNQQLSPAFVLSPQCPKGMEWNESQPTKPPYINIDMQSLPTSWRLEVLVELIQATIKQYPIDRSRIYIVGASMGGTGVWSALYRYPDLYAGAIIMNGRSDPATASYINTPVYVFHGIHDSLAPPDNSKTMTNALLALEKEAKLNLVDAGHEIVNHSITPESLTWLYSNRLHSAKLNNQFKLNPMLKNR